MYLPNGNIKCAEQTCTSSVNNKLHYQMAISNVNIKCAHEMQYEMWTSNTHIKRTYQMPISNVNINDVNQLCRPNVNTKRRHQMPYQMCIPNTIANVRSKACMKCTHQTATRATSIPYRSGRAWGDRCAQPLGCGECPAFRPQCHPLQRNRGQFLWW